MQSDPALSRRFQVVNVPEPSQDEALAVLMGLQPLYERHHSVKFAPGALRSAVACAAQYGRGKLPDSAIDVMDEAAALCSAHVRSFFWVTALRIRYNNSCMFCLCISLEAPHGCSKLPDSAIDIMDDAAALCSSHVRILSHKNETLNNTQNISQFLPRFFLGSALTIHSLLCPSSPCRT